MRSTGLMMVCGLAVLAGCSKKPAGQAGAPAAQAVQAPAIFQRPHPKVGLWRMSITSDAGPGIAFSAAICLDEKTESAGFMANPRAHASNCEEPKYAANPGGGVVFDETCKVSQRTIISHGVITGDFTSAYAADVTTSMDPPLPGGMGGGHSRIQAQWVGPCPAGQRPGQMTGLKLSGVGSG